MTRAPNCRRTIPSHSEKTHSPNKRGNKLRSPAWLTLASWLWIPLGCGARSALDRMSSSDGVGASEGGNTSSRGGSTSYSDQEGYAGSAGRRFGDPRIQGGQAVTGPTYRQIGVGAPVLDANGAVGVILAPSFADIADPKKLTCTICGTSLKFPLCRPGSSFDGGETFEVHQSERFAAITANGWGWHLPLAQRSPVRTSRLYFAVAANPYRTKAPHGGLWRSDDEGKNWTDNLFDGATGELGMVEKFAVDPYDADKVWINRGYDFGNIALSADSGATFRILCGYNGVEKACDATLGHCEDEHCGSGTGTWILDFDRNRMFYKHHFLYDGVEYDLSGEYIDRFAFSGLGRSASAAIERNGQSVAPALQGLTARSGTSSAHFLADGTKLLFLAGDQHAPWTSSPDLRSGAAIRIPDFGGARLLIAHPIQTCKWIAQAGDRSLQFTVDCGTNWTPLPPTGLPDDAVIVSAAFVPNDSGELLVFTSKGQRFLATIR